MTYQIAGLDPRPFARLFELSDAELAACNARKVTALAARGYPCRVSLEDARKGEELVLVHHTSHDVPTPYRNAYAIFVRPGVCQAHYIDTVPPVFEGRTLGLRGFGADGMLLDAKLAMPDLADTAIHGLFGNPAIAYIDAHNAAHGCFAARIERHGDQA